MWVDTRFGDFPQRMPDPRLKPGESTFTGWMLLSWHKHATASSEVPGHGPDQVTDENPRTFWRATANTSGQTLTLDLGGAHGERDPGELRRRPARALRRRPRLVTQFVLEGSPDGTHWEMLADLSHETRDHANAYVELDAPAHIRYVRYVLKHVGARHLAIADLRVFGHADGPPPASVLVSATRDQDTRNATVLHNRLPGPCWCRRSCAQCSRRTSRRWSPMAN